MRRIGIKRGLASLVLLIVFGVAAAIVFHRPFREFLSPQDFHITIKRVEFRREARATSNPKLSGFYHRSLEPTEEVLSVYVFISHEGSTPDWWLDDVKARRVSVHLQSVVFTHKNGKQVRYPTYPKDIGRNVSSSMPDYYAFENCYVPKGTSFQGSTMTGTVHLVGVASLRFTVPVDDSNTQPVDKSASITTPGIKIERIGVVIP